MNKKFPSFKECPGVLMERFIALFMQIERQEEKKECFDINEYTIDELVVLFELMGQEGLCQNAIADKIHKNKSTVKRTLDKLEKKGAIIKEKDKIDSRKYNIYLSECAKKLKQVFASSAGEEIIWFEKCLGKAGYKKFMAQLIFLYEELPKRFENKGNI